MTARKYDPVCSYPGCGRAHNARGLCGPHGIMARRGEPLRPLQNRTGPLVRAAEDRFAEKTLRQDDGCIVWTGGKTIGGYGTFTSRAERRDTKREMAHRWIYEQRVGPIPADFDIDHLCRNRACVNPDHLEAVTRQENIRRAFEGRTHCPQGHEYSPENTYVRPGTVHRKCRTCAHDRAVLNAPQKNAKRRAKRAAERAA